MDIGTVVSLHPRQIIPSILGMEQAIERPTTDTHEQDEGKLDADPEKCFDEARSEICGDSVDALVDPKTVLKKGTNRTRIMLATGDATTSQLTCGLREIIKSTPTRMTSGNNQLRAHRWALRAQDASPRVRQHRSPKTRESSHRS